MKTNLIFTILCAIAFFNTHAQTITISKKNSGDPTDVCNNAVYKYTAAVSGIEDYEVFWMETNGDFISQINSEAEIKWIATTSTEGNIGTIKAQLKNSSGNVLDTSDEIEVTIKSIKHLKPEHTFYTGGGDLYISPCESGQKSLEVSRLSIPGTGDLNPSKVYDYEWIIPKGWSMNGQTSDGTEAIQGDSYATLTYPASAIGGKIKVRG